VKIGRPRTYDHAFGAVERVIALTDGFALVPVEVDGPDLAHALVAHLGRCGHPCVVFEPLDEASWGRLAADLLAAAPGERGVVAVIGRHELPSTTGAGLRLVNQRRDSIAAAIQRPLLWCGPPSFLALTWERAPDFWSVRTVGQKIEPDTTDDRASSSESAATSKYRSLLEDARSQRDTDRETNFRTRLVQNLIHEDKLDEAERIAREGPWPEGDVDAELTRFALASKRQDFVEAERILGTLPRPGMRPDQAAEIALAHAVLAEKRDSPELRALARRVAHDALESSGNDAQARTLALVALGRADRSVKALHSALDKAKGVSPGLVAIVRAHLAVVLAENHESQAARHHVKELDEALAATESFGTPAERAMLVTALDDAKHALARGLGEHDASPMQTIASRLGSAGVRESRAETSKGSAVASARDERPTLETRVAAAPPRRAPARVQVVSWISAALFFYMAYRFHESPLAVAVFTLVAIAWLWVARADTR